MRGNRFAYELPEAEMCPIHDGRLRAAVEQTKKLELKEALDPEACLRRTQLGSHHRSGKRPGSTAHERIRIAPRCPFHPLKNALVAGRNAGRHSRGTKVIVVDATVVAGFLFPADQFHAQADAVRTKDPDWQWRLGL